MPRKYTRKDWVTTAQASLEWNCRPRWFLTRIKSGTFKPGIHYRNVSDGNRPTYQFCLAEIEKLYG